MPTIFLKCCNLLCIKIIIITNEMLTLRTTKSYVIKSQVASAGRPAADTDAKTRKFSFRARRTRISTPATQVHSLISKMHESLGTGWHYGVRFKHLLCVLSYTTPILTLSAVLQFSIPTRNHNCDAVQHFTECRVQVMHSGATCNLDCNLGSNLTCALRIGRA